MGRDKIWRSERSTCCEVSRNVREQSRVFTEKDKIGKMIWRE
jgi:hypothetical protein